MDSSLPCITDVKSINFASLSPYKSDHETFVLIRSKSGPNLEAIKNEEKTVPVKDKENKRTLNALLELASPS